jgi:hypothetical protein
VKRQGSHLNHSRERTLSLRHAGGAARTAWSIRALNETPPPIDDVVGELLDSAVVAALARSLTAAVRSSPSDHSTPVVERLRRSKRVACLLGQLRCSSRKARVTVANSGELAML